MDHDPKTEKQWLIDLQKDLLEDRAAERSQADPIYYGIRDIIDVVTSEGNEGRVEYYDEESCETKSVQDILDELADEDVWYLTENHVVQVLPDSSVSIVDSTAFTEYIEDARCLTPIYIAEQSVVVPDMLCMTRKDAQMHLDKNGHHYTENAHTYAMTAWRCPRYEHLIHLLRGIDFERSDIVFKQHTKKGENDDA